MLIAGNVALYTGLQDLKNTSNQLGKQHKKDQKILKLHVTLLSFLSTLLLLISKSLEIGVSSRSADRS